jgi:hypothetical protein
MKLFECQVCSQPLFFENEACEKCGHRLGFDPAARRLLALDPAADGAFLPAANRSAVWANQGEARPVRFCLNAAQGVCNWLIEEGDNGTHDAYCASCRHNRTIPDLSDPSYLEQWRKIENAKHRLTYTLLALRLPTDGLTFDILADAPGAAPVMTGHDNGLITLNLAEADDGEREKRRTSMGETYRTLLGHVRHEVGHYYWDKLVRDGGKLDEFRALFGDDREDYSAALQRHYANGPAADWRQHFVSAYASAHPWEDFAETFAHYLHIVDTLETAHAFGLQVRPRIRDNEDLSTAIDFDPHRMRDIGKLIDAWLPICFAVNSLNRSMGQPDLYPFILSPEAISKLGFMAHLVRE